MGNIDFVKKETKFILFICNVAILIHTAAVWSPIEWPHLGHVQVRYIVALGIHLFTLEEILPQLDYDACDIVSSQR